jgi:hypothetical protein
VLVSPNQREAEGIVGQEFDEDSDFIHGLDVVAERGARNVLITFESGAYGLFREDRRRRRFRAVAPHVDAVSVVGSGDVLLAAFLAARMDGKPWEEAFRIGGARVVRSGDDDAVTIVGAGITLHEAVKAADLLAEQGVAARVIDLYSVKPIDTDTIRAAARETGAILTVEDHWPEGGIGDAVLEALAADGPRPPVVKLAVREMPSSGTPAELLHAAGIDADCIADAARELAGKRQLATSAAGD